MPKQINFETEYKDFSLAQMGKRFATLRKFHEEAKTTAAQIWAEVDYLRFTAIPDKLEAENIESLRIPDVGTLSTRFEASCTCLDKDKLIEWLEAHDALDLVSSSVNGSTLKAFILGRIRDGEKIPDTDIIKFSPFTVATLTKC